MIAEMRVWLMVLVIYEVVERRFMLCNNTYSRANIVGTETSSP